MSAGRMVSYKAWLDTRWQFIVGLVLLLCGVAAAVLLYPQVVAMIPMAQGLDVPGMVGDEIRKGIELSSSFRGYAWDQINRQNLSSILILFPVLIGAAGVLAPGARGGFYTLALPVTRRQLVLARATAGLVEVFALSLAPFLAVPAFAPMVGETFSLVDSMAYTVCAFFGASVFFSLALWLSTVFSDLWRPLVITLGLAMAVSLIELVLRLNGSLPIGFFRTMNGTAWYETGSLPWLGLGLTAALSAALIYAAVRTFERRDY